MEPVLPRRTPKRLNDRKRRSSLDAKLKKLLTRKLTHQVISGRPSDTLLHHRRRLLRELTRWILPSEKSPSTFDPTFRDQLITLLATESKQGLKEIPVEESDWNKHINQWLKNNSADDIVFGREIFRILAVDGFSGIRPKDFKIYLSNILLPLRKLYRMHARGVRAMYAFFDQNGRVGSLTGTDSAYIILLALLILYVEHLPEELHDEQVSLRMRCLRSLVEGHLHKHSDYYRDIQNVNEDMLSTLAGLYTGQFVKRDNWETVGRDMLRGITMNLLQKFDGPPKT